MDMLKYLEESVNLTDKKDTSVISKAKEKLQAEIEQSNNESIKVIGEYLIKELSINTELAEIIAKSDKTIAKSLDAMKHEASKQKVGNMAVLTQDEGFSIVLKYYGFNR